ncbi:MULTISPECIES: alpha/beta hydrolase [Helcococcus]|uniref:Alpha/beta hydrolase n=1 Tax=Helcococcus bovis TaxID=3153252 RepID=A0ABW9F7H5_9FIRM
MQKKSLKFKLKLYALSLLIILLILLGVASAFLVNYALAKKGDGKNRNVKTNIVSINNKDNYKKQKELTKEFLNTNKEKEAEITSNDNLKLKGYYFENKSDKWVILLHGYRTNHTHNYDYAQKYFENKYNILNPDLRASGNSEGNYVGMGFLEKNDILLWINWIIDKNPNAEIILHGMSMGAATTMMVAGENTPKQVKLFIEDSGYTSAWDIFSSELKLRFNLPQFPIMYTSNLFSGIMAGYKFSDASAIDAVKKSSKPILFIHGDKDDFVPFEMMNKLYEAKTNGVKDKFVSKGAGHTKSIYISNREYWNKVFDFIEKNN